MADYGCGSWIVGVVLIAVGLTHLASSSPAHQRVGWVAVALAALLIIVGVIAGYIEHRRPSPRRPSPRSDG